MVKEKDDRKGMKTQAGAIMLEVVAVLSLMGLMGAMLFRQMYLRNQELHNIQMASEIRLVKEAFSSWIQANAVPLTQYCSLDPTDFDNVQPCTYWSASTLAGLVDDYLPDGYLWEGGSNLEDNYDLKLFGYYRGEDLARAIPSYYGVIVPKPNVLPDGGNGDTWNFRRAARVAMLIGIDGGAYDPTITSGDIAGAVGTWSLEASGIIDSNNVGNVCDGNDCPTHVAITGLDVFQPEVELPPVNVKMQEDVDLALHNAHVYGAFTAGGTGNSCYTKHHHQNATPVVGGYGYVLNNDAISAPSASCWPAFYVESTHENAGGVEKGTGAVRVANDLTVGQEYDASGNPSTAAITFDKRGMIVFKEKVKDPQTKKEINYMLDPKYTSVMNDVKIMSRGGAKLSEILPNYILKNVETHVRAFGGNPTQTGYNDGDVNSSPGGSCRFESSGSDRGTIFCQACYSCAAAYNGSVVKGSDYFMAQNEDASAGGEDNCAGYSGSSGRNIEVSYPNCPKGYDKAIVIVPEVAVPSVGRAEGDLTINTTVLSAAPHDPHDHTASSTSTWNYVQPADGQVVREVSVGGLRIGLDEDNTARKWTVIPFFEYQQAEKKSVYTGTCALSIIEVLTYCVFDKTKIDWNLSGAVDPSDTAPSAVRTQDKGGDASLIDNQADCTTYGGTWNAGTKTCTPSP